MLLQEERYCRTVVAVVDTGSFSAAATVLDTVQSNISIRIRHIEDELKVELFERRLRGIVLTPKGEKVYRYAKGLLAMLEQQEEELARLLSA